METALYIEAPSWKWVDFHDGALYIEGAKTALYIEGSPKQHYI